MEAQGNEVAFEEQLARLNHGLPPSSLPAIGDGRAAEDDEEHTVLGFAEFGAGCDPAELVGKRLRRLQVSAANCQQRVTLEMDDGSRYAVSVQGAAQGCQFTRYQVGFKSSRCPDESSCCSVWCGHTGGPPAPAIEDATLLLVPDTSPVTWDGGRVEGSGHVELGFSFQDDPMWYQLQGKEVELDDRARSNDAGKRQAAGSWCWRDVVLERLEPSGTEAGQEKEE